MTTKEERLREELEPELKKETSSSVSESTCKKTIQHSSSTKSNSSVVITCSHSLVPFSRLRPVNIKKGIDVELYF